jgi:hypothetical protein
MVGEVSGAAKLTTSSPSVISFKTPRQGVKPNIQLSFEYLPSKYVSNVTLKITNFYSEINIAQYRYMTIIAGYNNGPVCSISCEIMNCYVERPNPEGITVFSGVVGQVSDILNNDKQITFTLSKEFTVASLTKIAAAAGLSPHIVLPKEWNGIMIPVYNKTYTFANAILMQTWLNQLLSSISHNNKVPYLTVSISNGMMKVYGMLTSSSEESTVLIDKVSTAYMMGGHVVIKAPWNPLVTADTTFQMDSRYFRGRMGSLYVTGTKKKFKLFHIVVNFSTQTENDMELEAIDLSIGV